jgi:DNA-binding NarL/FixJ family response regulator
MPKRILIADDHESVLRRVRAAIESRPDWQVCGEAVNGREAVAKAQEVRPDLVILDFAMPHLNGLRAASEIHKVLPDVPIVMLTLYGSGVMQEVKQELKKYGITKLVDKAQSNDLVAIIDELLAQAQARVPLARPSADPLPESSTEHDLNPE